MVTRRDFVAAELKPLIDRRCRTLRGAADTAILGSGLAGLVSLYALLRFPGVFGTAACLSDQIPLDIPSTGCDSALAIAASRDLGRALPSAGRNRLHVDFGALPTHPAGARLPDTFVSLARDRG